MGSNKCNLCGHDGFDKVLDARDFYRETEKAYRLCRCRDCGLVFTDPPPGEAELDHFYDGEYYGADRSRFPWIVERAMSLFRWDRLRVARGLQPGKALDIGCGRGWFLDNLRRRGWQVVGTELSETAAAYARKAMKLEVRIGGELAGFRFPEGAFDLVSIFHVLEHIPDPLGTLREIRRIMAPGGRLSVQVPNFGTLQRSLFRDGSCQLDLPRHLFHFDSRSLERMVREAGFTVEATSVYSLEFTPYCFIQSLENRLLGGDNLLYYLLRKRRLPGKRSPLLESFRAVAALGGLMALGPAALTLTPLLALAGVGDVVEITASPSGVR